MFGTTGDFKLGWWERVAIEILKMGPIPKHVALILDGNRRFARKNNMANVWDGHQIGFDHVDDVVDMFLAIGIKEMTIYVFSIENFKRPQEEVDAIMRILGEKTDINQDRLETMKRKGISYEYIGNHLESPSSTLKDKIERNMILSKSGKSLKLNVAFVYTGRNETARGASQILQGLSEGHLSLDQVTPELLQELFTLHPWSPVDIMIRTSGECRFSDYLTWGCTDARLEFIPETWPEFSARSLIRSVWKYQSELWSGRRKATAPTTDLNSLEKMYVDRVRRNRWNKLEQVGQTLKMS